MAKPRTLTDRIESRILEYAILAKLSLDFSGGDKQKGEEKRKYICGWIEGEIKSYRSRSTFSRKQLSRAKAIYQELNDSNWSDRTSIERTQEEYES